MSNATSEENTKIVFKGKRNLWRPLALVGVALISIAIVAGYLDDVTAYQFAILSNSYESLLAGGLAGTVVAFVGLIGWAKRLGRGRRLGLAVMTFFFPWTAIVLGSPIDKFNIHGPSAFPMVLVVPASVLTLVLLVMAGLAPPRS